MQIKDIHGCCSVQEIAFLRQQYGGNGQPLSVTEWTELKAMQDFCGTLKIYGPDNRLTTPSGFYVFTAWCASADGFGTPEMTWRRAPLQYGERFKSFILEHQLGSVTESNEKPNRKVHANHLVKVYVWEPDQERLQEWYRANLKVVPPAKPTPAPVPATTASTFMPTESFTVSGVGAVDHAPHAPQPAQTPTLAEPPVGATARRRLTTTGVKVRKLRTIRDTAAARNRAKTATPSTTLKGLKGLKDLRGTKGTKAEKDLKDLKEKEG